MRARQLAFALVLAIAAAAGAPRVAHADDASAATPSGTFAVLGLDSDDEATEQQADALTGALRARARGFGSLELSDNTSSLEIVIAALKCPPKPDAACLTRIADHLKVDRFLYGWVGKGGPHAVTAEIHMWTRGKPDASTKVTFADNLKGADDETLRGVAGRALDKLFGIAPSGILTVHAGDGEGAVLVDGQQQATLTNGGAVVELRPGTHTIEVRVPGYETATRQLDVPPESNLDLTLPLHTAVLTKERKPSHPVSTRTLIALGTMGAGVVVGVIGTIEAVHFLSLQSDNETDHKTLGAQDFCNPAAPHTSGDADIAAACQRVQDAKSARTAEIVLYSVAGALLVTGGVIRLTDSSSSSSKTSSGRLAPHVVPYAGPREAGLDLSLKF